MLRLKRPGAAALLLAALATLAAGCDDDDDENRAQVRVVHAAVGSPEVDVDVGDERVATDLEYGEVSDFESVESGDREIVIFPAGTDVVALELTTDFEAAQDYTVVATGSEDDFSAVVLQGDPDGPPEDQAEIRVVHAAQEAGTVDIYVTAPGVPLDGLTPQLAGVTFEQASPYLPLDDGTWVVSVTPAGSLTIVAQTGELELDAGDERTAVALEAEGGGAPFAVLVLDDNN